MGGILLTNASYKGKGIGAVEKANVREGCDWLLHTSEIKHNQLRIILINGRWNGLTLRLSWLESNINKQNKLT